MLLYQIIKSIMYAELLEHICIIYGCECVKHCMHTRSPGPQNQQCYSCWVCVQIFWDLCSDQLLGDGAKVNFILTILPSIQHLCLLPSLLSQFQLPSSLYKPQLKSKPELIDSNDLVKRCLLFDRSQLLFLFLPQDFFLLRTMIYSNNLALSCLHRHSVTRKCWQALSFSCRLLVNWVLLSPEQLRKPIQFNLFVLMLILTLALSLTLTLTLISDCNWPIWHRCWWHVDNDAMAESVMPLARFHTLLGKRFLSLMENK